VLYILHYTLDGGRGHVLDTVVHQNVGLSEVIVTDVLHLDHDQYCSAFLTLLEGGKLEIHLKKLTDREQFQSLASELISPNIQIYSSMKLIKQHMTPQPL
jgi:hypothetical protein